MLKKKFSALFCLFLLTLFIAGCTENVGVEQEKPKNTEEKIAVTLYYPDTDALYLHPVQKEMTKNTDWMDQALKSLADQPSDKKLTPALPSKDLIKSMRIDNQIAYIDFDKKALEKVQRGASIEQIIIQSIAHTLNKNAKIESIVLTIDGNSEETLLGHIDILEAIKPDKNWVKE